MEVQEPGRATALYWAAEAGRTEIVKILLEHGADVDAQGWDERTMRYETALDRAEEAGHTEIVNLLLRQYGIIE